MILIADTSGVLAAFATSEADHLRARDALNAASLVVFTPLVLLELEVLGGRRIGRQAAQATVDWILATAASGRFRIDSVSGADLHEARKVQRHYAGLDLDLTDAVNVVVASRWDTVDLLTLDRRDVRAIVPLSRHAAFRLLPDDS
ncbi:PIN domain-containing protein [Tsukamurella sp. NPDC003166]|uniref:PIN domain-containing protein n=1 Tax=Tsukamurella sp. NPDC003166 TaxID=3154444 RepID=UPI0033AE323F